MSNSRIAYLIHSWCGLTFGWLLFAVCLTGTLVVYKFPLKALDNPSVEATDFTDKIGPDDALHALLDKNPTLKPKVISFPADIYSIHKYTVVTERSDGLVHRYWVDPVTAEVRDNLDSEFADFILRMHANLFLGQPGRWLIGILGITMLVSSGTGLWFHWRRLRRDLFNFRLGAHARKAWGDIHKAFGVWAFPFHIVIALTGAWLGIESLIGFRASDSNPIEIAGNGPGAPLPIEQIVARATALRPDFKPTHVNVTNYGAAGATIRVQGDIPGYRLVQRGQTMLVFDADSGKHLQTVDRTEQGLGRRLLAMVRPLHYGYFWPFWGELLYFLLGIASTFLVMSGMLIWADREKRKVRRTDGEAATRMERANVAVMGGLMLSLSALAVINTAARSLGSVSFNFAGSLDLLSEKPLSAELPLFLWIWLISGAALATFTPVAAWRLTAITTGTALLLLPLAGMATSGSLAGFFFRGGNEGLGYTVACFGLALLGAATARRLSPNFNPKENLECALNV